LRVGNLAPKIGAGIISFDPRATLLISQKAPELKDVFVIVGRAERLLRWVPEGSENLALLGVNVEALGHIGAAILRNSSDDVYAVVEEALAMLIGSITQLRDFT